MRLLFTAQDFGLGPASKMVELVRAWVKLGHPAPDVLARGQLRDYLAVAVGPLVRDIRSDAAAAIAVGPYAGIVNVMDPDVSRAAALCGVPVVYVDSLFHSWKWSYDDAGLALGAPPGDEFADLTVHVRNAWAHHWARRSLLQWFPGVEARAEQLAPTLLLSLVPPLSPAVHRGRRGDELFFFPGSLRFPSMPADRPERYLALLDRLAGILTVDGPFHAADCTLALPIGAPEPCGLRHLRPIRLDASQAAVRLGQARAVFAGGGIQTLLESLRSLAPLAVLPEFHRGYVENVLALTRWLSRPPPHAMWFLERAVQAQRMPTEAEIEGALSQCLNDDVRLQALAAALSSAALQPQDWLLAARGQLAESGADAAAQEIQHAFAP